MEINSYLEDILLHLTSIQHNSSNCPSRIFQPQSFDWAYRTVCELPPVQQATTKSNQKATDYSRNRFSTIIQVGSFCLVGWFCCTQDSQLSMNVDDKLSPLAHVVPSSTMKTSQQCFQPSPKLFSLSLMTKACDIFSISGR